MVQQMVRREAAKMSVPVWPSAANTISASEPDNIYLEDGMPFRITEMTKDVLIGEEWIQIEDIFQEPIPSRRIGMFKVSSARPKMLLRTTAQL